MRGYRTLGNIDASQWPSSSPELAAKHPCKLFLCLAVVIDRLACGCPAFEPVYELHRQLGAVAWGNAALRFCPAGSCLRCFLVISGVSGPDPVLREVTPGDLLLEFHRCEKFLTVVTIGPAPPPIARRCSATGRFPRLGRPHDDGSVRGRRTGGGGLRVRHPWFPHPMLGNVPLLSAKFQGPAPLLPWP